MRDEIMNLNTTEIMIINGLLEVAREAKEHSKLIYETYKHAFGIGQEEIWIWHEGVNCEYMTYKGVWKGRYMLGTREVERVSFEISIDPEGIFDYYKAEWLVEHGYQEEFYGSILTEYGKKKRACQYFRSFIKRIQESK